MTIGHLLSHQQACPSADGDSRFSLTIPPWSIGPYTPVSAKQTRSPLSEPLVPGASYSAREPGFSALAPGTRHSAPGAFKGLPARYWAVMKFIHDEGELMWLNNNPENRLPLGFAGRARRNARPAFFPAAAPRFSLRPCAPHTHFC